MKNVVKLIHHIVYDEEPLDPQPALFSSGILSVETPDTPLDLPLVTVATLFLSTSPWGKEKMKKMIVRRMIKRREMREEILRL